MIETNPEKLRQRFHELRDESGKARDKAAPLREQLDLMEAAYRKERAKLVAKIQKAEDGQFQRDQETAMIARALGGKVGAA